MDDDKKISFFVDWREDEKSSIEIDRALYLRQYFGVIGGVRYLFNRGFTLRIVFRVCIFGRKRAKKHAYLPISRGHDPAEDTRKLL